VECQVQGEVWLRVYDFAPLGGLRLSLAELKVCFLPKFYFQKGLPVACQVQGEVCSRIMLKCAYYEVCK